MTTFLTTDEQRVQLARIVVAMSDAGLPAAFVRHCDDLARVDQGAFELMELWYEDDDDEQGRDEILADLQEMLDDEEELGSKPVQKPYIRYDQLGDVVGRVREHKEKLRRLVDEHGGVSAVARKAGMHQSALSRLLNSPSMPRRTTLYRIANALDLSEADIAADFVR